MKNEAYAQPSAASFDIRTPAWYYTNKEAPKQEEGMKRVTIQDIADALGISRNTVSKAINNSGGLADATRDKILKKAVEMGYKQFSYVSILAEAAANDPTLAVPAGRTEVALLTASFFTQSNHFASLMVDGLEQELQRLGYTLKMHFVSPADIAAHKLPDTFMRDEVAAILCIEMFDYGYDEMLCALGLPVLFVDGPNKRDGSSLPADQLYMDNTSGITRLVSTMLARGVRRIGFVGDWEHCQSFFERYTAYRTAMMMGGAPVEEEWCIKCNHAHVNTQTLAELAARDALPQLLLCANDFIALDVQRTLTVLGKSVPGDVLLAGFDDAPVSRMVTPALTTVHIHTQAMAFSAVQLLMTRIKEPALDYRTVHTESELICRESTALGTD